MRSREGVLSWSLRTRVGWHRLKWGVIAALAVMPIAVWTPNLALFLAAVFLAIGFLGSVRNERAQMDHDGVRIGGSVVRSADQVRITGTPGGRMRIVAISPDAETLLLEATGHHSQGWTYDGVTALACRISEQIGGHLNDRRNRKDWRQWAHAQHDSARRAFHASIERHASMPKHRPWYPTEAQEPMVKQEMQQARYTVAGQAMFGHTPGLTITHSHVHAAGRKIPLHTIERVALQVHRVGRDEGRDFAHLQLWIFADGVARKLVQRDVARFPGAGRELKWLCDALEAAAARAEPVDIGTEQDIPVALRQLRE